jgi:hypothetical protein
LAAGSVDALSGGTGEGCPESRHEDFSMSNTAIATAIEERLESTTGPRSRLGYSTGRNVFDGSELLIAMKCYFDGSEGKDSGGDTSSGVTQNRPVGVT